MDDNSLAIDIRDLHFSYPDGTPALEGVDLQVHEGARVALIGPNGAGKSTLMLHLNGLLHGQGFIRVLGMELTESNLATIRRQVGLLFQSPDDQLFMPTVFDEVAFAALNAGYSQQQVHEAVGRALDVAGMSGYEKRHPTNLSLGQKKRIALASVLVTDNRMLILDEPSAGLDPAGRRALMGLLAGLDSTLIVATHDLDLAATLCPQTVAISGGRVLRHGDTSEILADTAFLRECGL